MIVFDDDTGIWNDMCKWLYENVPHNDRTYTYNLSTDVDGNIAKIAIKLNFSNSADETAFRLKFRL